MQDSCKKMYDHILHYQFIIKKTIKKVNAIFFFKFNLFHSAALMISFYIYYFEEI